MNMSFICFPIALRKSLVKILIPKTFMKMKFIKRYLGVVSYLKNLITFLPSIINWSLNRTLLIGMNATFVVKKDAMTVQFHSTRKRNLVMWLIKSRM